MSSFKKKTPKIKDVTVTIKDVHDVTVACEHVESNECKMKSKIKDRTAMRNLLHCGIEHTITKSQVPGGKLAQAQKP